MSPAGVCHSASSVARTKLPPQIGCIAIVFQLRRWPFIIPAQLNGHVPLNIDGTPALRQVAPICLFQKDDSLQWLILKRLNTYVVQPVKQICPEAH